MNHGTQLVFQIWMDHVSNFPQKWFGLFFLNFYMSFRIVHLTNATKIQLAVVLNLYIPMGSVGILIRFIWIYSVSFHFLFL